MAGVRTSRVHSSPFTMAPPTRSRSARESLRTQVINELAERRTNYDIKVSMLAKRGLKLTTERTEFDQLVESLGTYVRDANERQIRALKLLTSERARIESLDTVIREKRWKLNADRVKLRRCSDLLNRYQKLHDFVHMIIGEDKHFLSVDSVVRRHRSLVLSKNELRREELATSEELQRTRQELTSYMQSMENQLLLMHSQLGQQHTKLERARNEHERTETYLLSVMNDASTSTLTLGHIRLAVHNLFRKLERWHPVALPEDLNTDAEIAFLLEFVSNRCPEAPSRKTSGSIFASRSRKDVRKQKSGTSTGATSRVTETSRDVSEKPKKKLAFAD